VSCDALVTWLTQIIIKFPAKTVVSHSELFLLPLVTRSGTLNTVCVVGATHQLAEDFTS
jgi:hypothetical protein